MEIGEDQEPAAYPGKLARLMPDFHQDEQPSSARDYRLSPRRVAMWSSVAAVAAVAALIAVAAVNDADALNTVALYLAVIAFVAQLIMYVAQNESSARQLKQSQDVQRQTSMMLSEIREQAAAMQRKLNEEYGVVVNALVEQAATMTERLVTLQHGGPGPGEADEDEAPTDAAPVDAAPVDAAPTDAAAPDRALSEKELTELRDEIRAELEEAAGEAVQRYAKQQAELALPTPSAPRRYRPFLKGDGWINGPLKMHEVHRAANDLEEARRAAAVVAAAQGTIDMEKVNSTLAALEKARLAAAEIAKAEGYREEP